MEITALKIPSHMELKTFEKLMSYTSAEKQEIIKRYHNQNNAYQSLLADLLARLVICNQLHMNNQDIEFSYNKYGKPFLASHPLVSFNISHSGNWVVCMIDDHPVGIDIERIHSIDPYVAKRFFSKDEFEDLMAKEDPLKLTYFYDLWTLKESFVKMLGKGLQIPLNKFTIKLSQNNIHLESVSDLIKLEQPVYFKQYDIDPKYRLSACAYNAKFPKQPQQLSFSDLLNLMQHLD